ncbi:MAG: MBL fold metallo-hydrolase [Patescibacteria group bacterium]
MQISWHGLNCFVISVSTPAGEAVCVVDPYQNETGLRLSRALTADLVAVSHDGEDADNVEAVGSTHDVKPFLIDIPGEFEAKGIFVHAISTPRKEDKKGHRAFLIEAEGMVVAHLGALNRELTDAELEAMSNVDILLVPVGGGRYMSPKTASEVISQIEPRIVVPYAYAIDGVKEKLEDLTAFYKALGAAKREEVSKLKVTRKNLPEEDMIIYVLERA